MVVEYIRYSIPPESREAFVDAYRSASEQLDASEPCLAYELTECEEEPGNFILRIEWTSTREHLEGFRKSEVFPQFFQNIKAFIGNIEEMRHYGLTAVVKRK
jgi:quinol monooxygenase YgiN